MWKFWLIVAGICFVIESFTIGFLVFWFGIGALAALVASLFISNIWIQSLIFIIVSSLLLIFTKPLVKKFVKEGIVVESIDTINGVGKVKVNGELWSATSLENIEKGTKVKVLKVNGVKLEVEKLFSNSTSN